jgi:Fe-S oxidoreductase
MVTLAEPTPADLTLENLLDTEIGKRLMTCIQCGVCVGTCPYGDVMVHTPRRLIEKIKKGFVDEVLGHDDMLNCVTCYACWSKCPRGIALTDVVLPLVKEQVLLNLPEMPAELQGAFESTLRYGNPLGESPRKRAAWTAETELEIPVLKDIKRPVELLWVVECYASYYPRGQDNARATARIFDALEIDYAILGNEEKCAGECARLAGETGLFDTLREQNIATFEKYEFESMVTSDPHAFDAFAFLYPFLGFQKPVSHTTPFVASRLEQLEPLLTRDLGYKITYHDTCVLGRHNEMFTEPRKILAALPGIEMIEMPHNRDNTICCGGGGGGMWLDTLYKAKGHERLSDRRVAEALATGADVLAVSCPYEVPRFEDSLKVLGGDDRMVVRDVMELVAEALGG